MLLEPQINFHNFLHFFGIFGYFSFIFSIFPYFPYFLYFHFISYFLFSIFFFLLHIFLPSSSLQRMTSSPVHSLPTTTTSCTSIAGQPQLSHNRRWSWEPQAHVPYASHFVVVAGLYAKIWVSGCTFLMWAPRAITCIGIFVLCTGYLSAWYGVTLPFAALH